MQRKIKVVHIVQNLEVGGIEKVLAALVRGLDRRAFDVEVWCLVSGGKVADQLKADGQTVRVLGLRGYHSWPDLRALGKLLLDEKADILHCHSYFGNTFGRLACLFRRRPFVITHIHTTAQGLKPKNILMDKLLCRRADRVLCVGLEVRDSLLKAGYPIATKAEVVYNGSGESRVAPMTPGSHGVLAVGSLFEHKGHRYLLTAMKDVLARIPDARLTIAGVGPLKEELSGMAQALGIADAVRFADLVKDISGVMSEASVFVQPSLREGISIAVIEAMAARRPVVAFRTGGLIEQVDDGKTGFLVDVKDSLGLAEKITTLLRDPALCERMGESGYRKFKDMFSIDVMCRRIAQIYSELLDQGRNKT
jgi:glycosyltransferase involved in cell wall biosynthesis